MKIDLSKILTDGKAFYLAYDQVMEHGPIEFNDENVNPERIIEIARKGKYNGLIVGKGIAEKYNDEIVKSKVPLILKLNGKTNLYDGEPMSEQLCTVEEALQLGACAVGYTIYIGSEFEDKMLKEFENIERGAHNLGIPVIAWIYPRGKSVDGKPEGKLMAYATRVALEIGADIVKIKYDEIPRDLEWAVKSAGKCKVVVAGGAKIDESEFLEQIRIVMASGASGVAVGRNIWQNESPEKISKKIREIVFS